MPIVIDQMSEEPIYQQIRTQVIGAIATGELSPGESFPRCARSHVTLA